MFRAFASQYLHHGSQVSLRQPFVAQGRLGGIEGVRYEAKFITAALVALLGGVLMPLPGHGLTRLFSKNRLPIFACPWV